MERTVTLNLAEIAALDAQDPSTESGGGFQRLLVKLQRQLDRTTRELKLDDGDQRRIPKYAFDYGQGGWEDRLVRILAARLDQHWADSPPSRSNTQLAHYPLAGC